MSRYYYALVNATGFINESDVYKFLHDFGPHQGWQVSEMLGDCCAELLRSLLGAGLVQCDGDPEWATMSVWRIKLPVP